MKSSTPQRHGWVLADGHVHIHELFSEYTALDRALDNFNQTAARLELTGLCDCVLFLTESSRADWFARQQARVSAGRHPEGAPYRCTMTEENVSLRFEKDPAARLIVIAGRQIVSSERLEVLALGLGAPYPDGRPLRTILTDIREKGCIGVLPWGVGKWLGTRKNILSALLADMQDPGIFLGDSGNRPFFWPLSPLFHPAGRPAPGNLPGSDPLPLAGQEKRIGSYGFVLNGSLDTRHPFRDVRTRLLAETACATAFGEPERLWPFLRNQTLLRLRRSKQ